MHPADIFYYAVLSGSAVLVLAVPVVGLMIWVRLGQIVELLKVSNGERKI